MDGIYFVLVATQNFAKSTGVVKRYIEFVFGEFASKPVGKVSHKQ
jgi:hypothetical protein